MTVHPHPPRKPGSDHGDEPPIVVDDGWDFDEPLDGAATRQPRRRVLVATVAVIGLLAAAAVVTVVDDGGSGPDRPNTSDLAAVESGRLPSAVSEVWSTRFAGSGNAVATALLVGDDGLVVTVVDDGSRDRSMVAGVDTASGEQVWRRSFPFAPSEMSPLLQHDGVVVIEQNNHFTSNRLIGLSATTGDTVWERRLPGSSVSGVLDGTGLVANVAGLGAATTTFYSPLSGESVGEVDGRIATTDLDGTWLTSTESAVDEIDLSGGSAEPTTIVRLRDAGEHRVASVNGRLLAFDDLGRLAEVDEDGDFEALQADSLPTIRAMWPTGGSSFVAAGDGEVFGVELVRDAATLTWRHDAAVHQFALTAHGLILVLAVSEPNGSTTDGWLVVDGATGLELAQFQRAVRGGGAIQVAADGFVTSPDGSQHIAHDLDGEEIWRLDDTGRLAIGDGLVVTLTNTPSGFRLTGYGG